jgi:hypothetical protein
LRLRFRWLLVRGQSVLAWWSQEVASQRIGRLTQATSLFMRTRRLLAAANAGVGGTVWHAWVTLIREIAEALSAWMWSGSCPGACTKSLLKM